MAKRIRPASQRGYSSLSSRLLVPVLIAAGLLVTATIYTVVNGELRLPFVGGAIFSFGEKAVASEHRTAAAGTVEVYVAPRVIPAFTKITREHLSSNGVHSTMPVALKIFESRQLFRAKDQGALQRLLGRVLKRQKSASYAYDESDFLPVKTKPGPNAGIPPGMRGVWLDVSKVTGLADLRAGDRIDLVAAAASAKQTTLDTGVLGNVTDTVMKARLAAAAGKASKTSLSSSWVVARGARVIAPVRRRPQPGSSAARGAGPMLDEIFLAMEPNDVVKLSQALAQKITLLAAPRSSQPTTDPVEIVDDVPADATADLRKLLEGDQGAEVGLQMVEVIRGGVRETVTVPRTTSSEEKR